MKRNKAIFLLNKKGGRDRNRTYNGSMRIYFNSPFDYSFKGYTDYVNFGDRHFLWRLDWIWAQGVNLENGSEAERLFPFARGYIHAHGLEYLAICLISFRNDITELKSKAVKFS
jgi:hypothetical protein